MARTTRAWDDFSHKAPQDPVRGRSGAATLQSRDSLECAWGVGLADPCFVAALLNTIDVPDGGIRLSSETHVDRPMD